MICIRLEGGLGNQLYQYAIGRALSLQLGTELLLDTSKLLRNSSKVTQRHFELHHFRHKARIATKHESNLFPWLHRIAPISHWISPWHTFIEKDECYDPDFRRLTDNTFLIGYWQSYKYFSNIASDLMHDFCPAEPLSYASSMLLEQIESCSAVALHIRRGDYVSRAVATEHHGVLSLSYYSNALRLVNERVISPRYFVFSDDPVWCRRNLPLQQKNSVFVDHNVGADAWQDLLLLSRCQYHVIANSSFSWWGAWLGDQHWPGPQRLVVAPDRWFSSKNMDKPWDRFPAHWIIQN